ncbi:FMRFamide receptor, partial [Folsomia candida]
CFYLKYCRFIVPFVLLLTLNFRISKTLKEYQKIRKTLTNQETNDVSLSKIAVAIVTFSLSMNVFSIVSMVLKRINETYSSYAFVIFVILVVINSSINFIFYCAFGKVFREELIKLWKMVCPLNKKIEQKQVNNLSQYSTGSNSSRLTNEVVLEADRVMAKFGNLGVLKLPKSPKTLEVCIYYPNWEYAPGILPNFREFITSQWVGQPYR